MLQRITVLLISIFGILSCNDVSPDSKTPMPGREFIVNSKFWLHRSNEIDKIINSGYDYKGIEIDLYITNSEVFVTHDYNETDSFPDLHSYTDSLKKYYPDIQIWLDAKNLSVNNYHILDSVLSVIDYEIEDYIIESYSSTALANIYNLGYFTCYWVPTPDENRDEDSIIQIININLENCTSSALSGHYSMLDFLNRNYPTFNKHIWTNGLSESFMDSICGELLLRSDLKIVLVDFKNNCMDIK